MNPHAFAPASHPTASRRRVLAAGVGLGLSAAAPLAAFAQEKYPARPITLVVPFPPGGTVDMVGRLYATPLSTLLGVPVLVENRPGAGGSTASLAVSRAKPDGYTLVVSSQSSHLANPLTQPKLAYEPIKDFESITILMRQPNVLAVHPSVPAKTFQEFVAYAKAHPEQLNYGSGGVGSMGQLNVELLQLETGIKTTHVPYRGGTPLITGLLSNEVQLILDAYSLMLPHIQAGKLRALAVASPNRMPQTPDVPTLAELGYPKINLTSWAGIAAPAGTPAPVVQTLYKALRKIGSDPEMVATIKERGLFPPDELPPAAFEKMMADRLASYGEVVRRANIKAE